MSSLPKHSQPHCVQRPQLFYPQRIWGLALCRAVGWDGRCSFSLLRKPANSRSCWQSGSQSQGLVMVGTLCFRVSSGTPVFSPILPSPPGPVEALDKTPSQLTDGPLLTSGASFLSLPAHHSVPCLHIQPPRHPGIIGELRK